MKCIKILSKKERKKERKKAKNDKERKHERRFLSFVYCVCYPPLATKREKAIYIPTSAKAIFITTSANVTKCD